jgi:hypothetical protein
MEIFKAVVTASVQAFLDLLMEIFRAVVAASVPAFLDLIESDVRDELSRPHR